MVNAMPILSAILALTLSAYSTADELTDAAERLCETIKTCALEAVSEEGSTDELRLKMDSILEGNCAAMRSRVQAVPADHKLYQPAIDCLRSMASLGCQQLHNAGEVKTPACAEYDQQAKAASTVTP